MHMTDGRTEADAGALAALALRNKERRNANVWAERASGPKTHTALAYLGRRHEVNGSSFFPPDWRNGVRT